MKIWKKLVTATIVTSLTTGCAVSRSAFIEEARNLSDTDVCRAYIRDKDKIGDRYVPKEQKEKNYLTVLKYEKNYRDLYISNCKELVSKSNSEAVLLGLGALAASALIYSAAKSGGGYSNNQGYAWDAFYDGNYNTIWRCRNKSNGQFANDLNCSTSIKVDTTWPAK